MDQQNSGYVHTTLDTGYFVYTGPFNIFTLFTRNFQQLGVQIFVRLRLVRVNGTPKRTKFFNRSKICPVPCVRSLIVGNREVVGRQQGRIQGEGPRGPDPHPQPPSDLTLETKILTSTESYITF